MAGDDPSRPAPSPAGDRKVVTVLFADLAGSTSMQERLDAETTARLMDRVQQVLSVAIEAHGGRVVKSTGDGLMAVFGIPILREDDALRAVEAGVEMHESFADLAAEIERLHGMEIGLRVGVNSGEVVVSPDTDDIVGDPVNVAARLEGAAGLGDVLVGPETARLVRDHVELDDAEPLELKGKREPVPAARVVGVGRATPVAKAFLGREEDLAGVLAQLDDATEHGHARLVTVVGFPGLGKSRLAGEVAEQVSDRTTVVDARFVADTTSSFAPIATALRDAVDLRTLELDEDLERVASTIDALAAGSAAGTTEQIFWAVRRCLEAVAADRPVLMLLDDVQWAEAVMLDLIEHLTEWLAAPVLLLALARPELRDLRPSLLEPGGPPSMVLVLAGLDDEACRRLALDLLDTDQLPEAVLSRAIAAGEGNPLFLRELLRLLVDDGVLRREGDRWAVTVEVEAIELPASVHATIAARIEQLDPDERTVLQTASVVGRHFARGAVASLLPRAVADRLDVHLSSLHRRALLDPEGTWWHDERMFRFHHVLIRDAAYRRILKEARSDLHVRYADWLMERPGEHDDVLGHHLGQAVEYRRELGAETDPALVERAVGHLATAGRRALEADDVVGAASLFGRALELVPGEPALLRDRAEALVASGDMNAAAAVVTALAEAATDERSRAIADVYEAQLAGQRTPDTLREVAERAATAAAVLAAHGDDIGVAKAEAVQATALAGIGQVGACEGALDRSLAAARRAGDTRLANVVLSIAPAAALWGPSPVARASGRCLDVVRVLRITTWAPQVEARALHAQAVLEALRDRADAARRMLDSARRTFTDLGHRYGLLETAMHAGLVELLADRPAEAERFLREARDGFEALGSRVSAARATALLARALLELDRCDEAGQLADPSLGGDDLKASIGLLGVAAEVAARRGAAVEAEALARRAVALAEPTDALVDHADARLSLARVFEAAGKAVEAADERRRAQALYNEKGATVGVRRAGAMGAVEPPTRSGQPVQRPATTWERRWRPNRASAAVEAWGRDANAGAPVDARYHPDLVWDDHTIMRTTISNDQLGSEWEDVVDGFPAVAVEVMATLGDRHVLSRMTSRWTDREAGEMEWTRLFVSRVGGDERFVRFDTFWEDALDDAVACLFERWAEDEAGLASDAARATAIPLSAPGLVNARSWEEMRESLADDVVLVDHRPTGSGPIHGPEAVTEWFAAFVDHTDATLTRTVDLLAVEPQRLLSVTQSTGELDGAPFVAHALVVVGWSQQGRFGRLEMFSPDQVGEAFAAYDRLAPPTDRRRVVPNRATELIHAWADAMRRLDQDALAAMIGDGFVWSSEPLHMDAAEVPIDQVRIIPPGADIDIEIVATMGERHTLYRLVANWHDDDRGRVDWRGSYVLRVTDEGLFDRIDCFEHDQVGPAAACLVERWAEDELDGAERARAMQMAVGLRAPEAFTAIADIHAIAAHGIVATFSASGSMAGAPFESDAIMVISCGPSGHTTRTEYFPLGRLDDALDRFDRFDAPVIERVVRPNLATRYGERWVATWNTGDVEAIRRLHDDRHVLVHHESHMTLDRSTEWDGEQRLIGARAELEPLATLGQRHALFRLRLSLLHPRSGGDVVHDRIMVTRTSPEGDCSVHDDLFLPEHLHRALGCLFERWAEDELDGSDRRRALNMAQGVRFPDLVAARDWAGYRAVLAEDAVHVDHRPASSGELHGADAVVAWIEELDAVAGPVTVVCEDVLAVADGAVMWRNLASAETPGGLVMWPSLLVARCDGDGRLDRAELFPVEDRQAAFACFERFAGGAAGGSPAAAPVRRVLANRASRAVGGEIIATLGDHHVMHRDADGFLVTTVDDQGAVAYQERFDELVGEEVARLGSQSLYRRSDGRFAVGRERLDAESFDRALEELVRRWAVVDHPGDLVVEQRAEAMVRALQIEVLILSQDWDGLRATCDEQVVFVDHVGRSGRVEGTEPIRRWAQPLFETAKDTWAGLVEVLGFDPDRVLLRSASIGSVEGAAYDWEGLVAMRFAPDGRLASLELFDPRSEEDAWAAYDGPPLVRHHRVKPNLAWAAVQRRAPVHHLLTVGDRHTLWRDGDQLVLTSCDGAGDIVDERRFDSFLDLRRALYASALEHEGIAFRHERVIDLPAAIAAGRWDDVAARYSADAVVFEHRPLRPVPAVAGRDSVVEWMRAYRADDMTVDVVDLLAISPLALLYQTRIWGSAGGGGFESFALLAVRLDEDGRVLQQEQFDPDQLDEAWAAYERLVSQAPDNGAVHILRRYATALANGDLETAVACNAPDVVSHDRRPIVGGEPKIGREGAHRETKAILDFDKAVVTTVEPIETRGDRLALVRQAVGVDRVIEYLVVSECDAAGGLFTKNFMYDESQMDEALAELDRLEAELAGGSGQETDVLTNIALDVQQRWVDAAIAGDIEGAMSLIADDHTFHDCRSLVGNDVQVGAEHQRELLSTIIDLGMNHITMERLAFRGDRLGVVRFRFSNAAGDEVTMLSVFELDESLTKQTRGWTFDEEEIDRALALLDERHAELMSVDGPHPPSPSATGTG